MRGKEGEGGYKGNKIDSPGVRNVQDPGCGGGYRYNPDDTFV